MKEVALNFWNERDMSNAVVALSKSYNEKIKENLQLKQQLTKAVLIIKNLLHLWEDVMTEDTIKSMINEAHQFLKEVDR